MRVLQMLGSLNRGGQETFVVNLYKNIDKEKIQFDFLVSDNKQSYDYENTVMEMGAEVHKVTLKSKNPIKSFIQTYKVVKSGNYKVVHKHSNTSLMSIDLIAAKLAGAKQIIAHSHSTTLNNTLGRKIHYLFRPLLNNISTTKLSCSKDAGLWMFGRNKMTIVNNGIEIDEYKFNQHDRDLMRAKLNIDDDRFVIGHIGRFVYAKNHLFILRIMDKVRLIIPNALLVLVGDGELRSEIEKQIHYLGLEDHVLLLGVRTDVSILLKTFDTFVFPSIYEGFPVTLVEAQASGLPCIISDNITSEVCITNLVERISLESPIEEWTTLILNSKIQNNKRILFNKKISEAKFDISDTVALLSESYKNTGHGEKI